jgi:hypothetical protein
MKKRSAKSAIDPVDPIEVILSVTKFNDVLRAGRVTSFVMRLGRRHPLATIEGATIFVRKPGAPILFKLTTGDGTRERYYPIGITFVRANSKKATDALRLGFINFPERDTHTDEKEMLISDVYKDVEWPVLYKFSVVVQRGSDGKIGIIDPDIVHEDEE